jgi:opacity protein-like surface antigen
LGDINVIKKFLVVVFILAPVFAFAQVAPATRGGVSTLSVGAEYSNFKPDFVPNRIGGITVFADLDRVFLRNLGFEGEARWLRFDEPLGEHEDHYLIGPRYRLLRYHGLSAYAKFLMGGGFITYPSDIGSGSYFAYAPGGTVEYRLTRRWSVRGDYEYQRWPSAPGPAFPYPSHGLAPNGFSIGASYRLF